MYEKGRSVSKEMHCGRASKTQHVRAVIDSVDCFAGSQSPFSSAVMILQAYQAFASSSRRVKRSSRCSIHNKGDLNL